MESLLTGRRVLITRPRAQSEILATILRTKGVSPIISPAMELLPLEPDMSEVGCEFDLIVFVSPNSVDYGWKAIRPIIEVDRPPIVATVGLATARKLKDKARNILVPEGEGGGKPLIRLLRKYSSERIRSTLIVRGQGGDDYLETSLRDLGCSVDVLECYQRVDLTQPQESSVRDEVKAGIDAWVVTSRQSLLNIWMQFRDEQEILKRTPLFVNHSAVASIALERDVKDVFVCGNASEKIREGLEAWFSKNTDEMKGVN